MVLRYWGARGLDAESFASLVDRGAGGIRTNRLMEDLRRRGWNAVEVEGREELVEAELGRGRPVLALIEDRPGTFHYIVIVAATPHAIVLHDPARTPFRVMEREQFARRWSRADRWMAVVTPIESSRSPEPPAPVAATEGSSCADLIASGVQRAQAGQFDEAERRLTSALSCGGAAPVRELAGLRLLQRRWLEVGELATAALAVDPMDEYAWQLLATSRFVQNDPDGALEAWNRIEQPRVDLVAVAGLTHTRQRVVERLLAVPSQALLTPRLFDLSARRLKELPSAIGTRIDFVPRSGVAELRAHVVERPLIPSDPWSYAALGLVGALFYSRLPHARAQAAAPQATALGPSRRTVYKLAALFSLDSFAGGFTVQSLLALWLFERFDLSLAAASAFFFWSNVLTAFSYPVAARLGRRFGLVNTMVFTHIPSSICLILAAFAPSLSIVFGLLLVRSALSQMDVPTRTSYVMAVVTPAERTAAASVTAVPRSLASAVSPALSGALLSTSFAALPLVICGVLKIVYDVSLLYSFRHIKPPEERPIE